MVLPPKKQVNLIRLIAVLLAVIAVACLTGGLIILFAQNNSKQAPALPAETVPATSFSAVPATVPSTVSEKAKAETGAAKGTEAAGFSESSEAGSRASAAPQEFSQTAEESAPAELEELLALGGFNRETLRETGTEQLVVVSSEGTSAELSFFEKTGGKWQAADELHCSGFVGIEGAVTEISEQVSGTPKGLYPIGQAFYQNEAPETGLNSFPITAETYWVDDPDSAFYNQKVEGTAEMDWNSAERMADIAGYRYGFVIRYNMPAEYNKGSAIFFHIGYAPTQGCVAVSEEMVLAYLARLNAGSNPYILII